MEDSETQRLVLGGRTSSDRRLLCLIQLVYGCGHVLNDLCAASWFTYMLVFFEFVSGRSSTAAGGLVLVGQVADGITTPIVGILCDRSAAAADQDVPVDAVSKRLPWHLGGSVLVLFSYPFLFMSDVQTTFGASDASIFAWFCTFVTLFQIGWATTQISHLSLIPDLSTGCSERRCSLNATRYAATVLSTVAVYIVCLVLLGTASSGASSGAAGPASHAPGGPYKTNELSPKNHTQFRWLAVAVTGTGFFFTHLIFHLGMRLATLKAGHLLINTAASQQTASSAPTRDVLRMWLSCNKAWCTGVMYMCTRLVVNIAQTYLPYYLTVTLGLTSSSIALGPLILYTMSFIASVAVPNLDKVIGPEKSYVVALCGILGACSMLYFTEHTTWMAYVACGIFGFFSSILMVSCLSLVAKLIGDRPGPAFVYGAFSFLDKLSSGVAIMLIQYFKHDMAQDAATSYYRLLVSLFPMCVAGLGLISVALSLYMKAPVAWDDYCHARDSCHDVEERIERYINETQENQEPGENVCADAE